MTKNARILSTCKPRFLSLLIIFEKDLSTSPICKGYQQFTFLLHIAIFIHLLQTEEYIMSTEQKTLFAIAEIEKIRTSIDS